MKRRLSNDDVPKFASFVNLFLLFMFCVCHVFLFVHCSFVDTCLERVELLAPLYVMFYCVFVSFITKLRVNLTPTHIKGDRSGYGKEIYNKNKIRHFHIFYYQNGS